MECPKCGAYNADTASFCSLCNEPFPKAASAPEIKQEKEQSAEKEEVKENVIEGQHSSPGFGIKIKKSTEPKPQKETTAEGAEPTGKNDTKSKKAETTPEKKTFPLDIGNITDWLYPAVLSTIIALIAIFLVPKEQINANLTLGKIILAVFLVGFVVSSDGIVKTKLQSALMGWLLGVSAGSLAFLLIFFSLLLVRISPEFYTIYFLGSEVLIVCVLLAVAIALFWSLEKVTASQLARLILGTFVISLLISWLVLKWTNPLPFAAFIAWPVSYYLLRLIKKD